MSVAARSVGIKKHINKIKNSHSWVVLVAFILLSVLAFVATVAFGSIIIEYVIDSKLSASAERIVFIAGEYSRIGDSYLAQLDDSDLVYVIEDPEGNLIHSHGDDTRGDHYSSVSFLDGVDSSVVVYDDINDDTIKVEKTDIEMSHSGFINTFMNPNESIRGRTDLFEVTHSFPVWIKVNVPSTDEVMFARADIDIKVGDSLLIIGFLVISGVFFFLTFIMLIVFVVVNMVNQKKNLNTFFIDHVTGGRNWNWYLVRGSRVLAMRRHRDDKFAIANIFFVNYRNYVLGHSVKDGERMLKRVCEVIQSYLGKDEIVVRSTTTGFALLLIYEDEERLRSRLKAVIKDLEGIDDDHDFSFQIGVCLPADKDGNKDIDIETEYNNACAAREMMEESSGSGIEFFDDEILRERVWFDTVTENQKQALDNEEFKIYYQPKYNPNNDELCGAEALIRWDSPKFGFVSPGRFIPIFEKNGFITSIDHFMVVHVARDQARWIKEGFTCVPVSVNISRAHFIENDLAEQIKRMVDKEGCPRELIEIELTESAFFDDKKTLIATIRKLREFGFKVSMDDFGSGYSSLNSLKDMPLDVLKLDAGFFRGEGSEDRGKIVVTETIRLAKNLKMMTVAEGVESRELVDFLADNGCDMIQGYYYAKPMPGKEYEERMSKERKEEA